MTNREAIEYIKRWIELNDILDKEALDLAIQALEKQEPKKVLLWEQINNLGDCPNCRGTTNRKKSPKVCRFCGQRLDWSE